MVCPCCVSTPPCPPCAECDWPYKWPGFLFEIGDTVECDAPFFSATNVRYQDIYDQSRFMGVNWEMPPGISWKPGYPAALGNCTDYVWVADRSLRACCYDCEADGNPYKVPTVDGEKQKHRILRISCPDGPESLTIQDVTNDALDGGPEIEFLYPTVPPPNCGAKTCLPYMPFFPTPDPVCNEFP